MWQRPSKWRCGLSRSVCAARSLCAFRDILSSGIRSKASIAAGYQEVMANWMGGKGARQTNRQVCKSSLRLPPLFPISPSQTSSSDPSLPATRPAHPWLQRRVRSIDAPDFPYWPICPLNRLSSDGARSIRNLFCRHKENSQFDMVSAFEVLEERCWVILNAGL